MLDTSTEDCNAHEWGNEFKGSQGTFRKDNRKQALHQRRRACIKYKEDWCSVANNYTTIRPQVK